MTSIDEAAIHPQPSRWHRSPPVIHAAREWRDECFMADGSVFSTERLWTIENLRHLKRFFVDRPDKSSRDFFAKLREQLRDAPPPAVRLAAELLWLLYLPISEAAMQGTTKRAQIRKVWEWSGEAFSAEAEYLSEALDEGVAKPGPAYATHRWRELGFAIELTIAWKALAERERTRLINSPWDFAAWLDALPTSAGRQFRHMLLYLIFPEHFERIFSIDHKRAIIECFRELHPEPGSIDLANRLGLDRALYQLRSPVAERYPSESVDFYLPPVVEIWRGKQDGPTPWTTQENDRWYRNRFGERSVWTINAGERGRLWPEFLSMGLIAIPWSELGDLSAYETHDDVRAALMRDDSPSNPTMNALACWEFSRVMQPGDLIIAKRGRQELLGYGFVESGYRFDDSRAEYPHVRDVRWERTGPLETPDDQRITSKTLTRFDPYKNWVRYAIERLDAGREVTAFVETRGSYGEDHYSLEDAAEDLFLEPDELSRIVDALARKKNLILQGPPGVGKTFIARRIAYALMRAKAPARVRMIQFHQSYAYEDFVQGWRPREREGFERRDGVFHQFCRRAAADPENDYVFIIDEINRGNLSKIFGELMMLIEVDKRGEEYAIPLTYSTGEHELFHVPANVYILGMMNTADRSLAMVDYALRRRFAFFSLEPAFGSELFSDHLSRIGASSELIERIVTRMSELNEVIRQDHRNLGPGFEIGHSFFVPEKGEEAGDESWYERVIRQEIEPLLHEYWFDEGDRVAEQIERLLR